MPLGGGLAAADGPLPIGDIIGGGIILGAGIYDTYKAWQYWNENTEDEEMCPIPDSPSDSPGEDWEWKGSGPPESGKGNWVNVKTGQKLHPDLNHLPPKGPHWGLTNPDGSKWDYFPGKGWVKN